MNVTCGGTALHCSPQKQMQRAAWNNQLFRVFISLLHVSSFIAQLYTCAAPASNFARYTKHNFFFFFFHFPQAKIWHVYSSI
jgi:hypothetical protein